MTEQLHRSAASEVLDFLNSIEGAGYGGMASFEIARQHAREMVVNGVAQTAVDSHYEDIEAAARAIFQVLNPEIRYTPQDSIWYRKAAEAAARCFTEVDEPAAAQPPAAPVEQSEDCGCIAAVIGQHERSCRFAETERRCQKCGEPTKGEEALVDGQIWCHPCADHPRSSAGNESEKPEPFYLLSCREAKQCLHIVPGCICEVDPTSFKD